MNEDKNISKKRALGEVFFTVLIIYALLKLVVLPVRSLFPNVSFTIIGSVYYILCIAIIAFIVKIINKSTLYSIGLKFKPLGRKILLGVSLGISLVLLTNIIHILTLGKPSENLFGDKMGISTVITQLLYYTFFVGIAEETIYRGFIFHRLNQAFSNKIMIILITSILFSFTHINMASINMVQAIETFIASAVLCSILYLTKDRSIIPLIIAHGIIDVFHI